MSEDIVGSVGRPGVSRRSYQRIYVNANEPQDRPGPVFELVNRLERVMERRGSHVSRVVLRSVMDVSVLQELHAARPALVEAALPLHAHDDAGSWLVMLGHNSEQRSQPLVPTGEMRTATHDLLAPATINPHRHKDILTNRNYTLTQVPWPIHQQDLHRLWGNTFEWDQNQIMRFGSRVIRSMIPSVTPEDRDIWFSGIGPRNWQGDPANIVSAAMAERLDMQGFNKTVHIVESTEWRTRRGSPEQPAGLVVPTLVGLNEQILRDLPDALIVAECNFASRADRRGHAAGFIIPDRAFAPQILHQNVGVEDGTGYLGLRDFSVMWLPPEVVEGCYAGQEAGLSC